MEGKVDQESSEDPSGQSAQKHETQLDSIFMVREDKIITFVKNELKKMQNVLNPDYPECLESQREDDEQMSSREAFVKITLDFMRRMNQEELADHLQSMEEIQQSLTSGSLSTDKLSPAQWSALAFILLSSEKDLDEFDLKKYSVSEEVLLRLLPVVKASNKALLRDCNLSERSCKALSSALSSPSCNLRELDLSNNNLNDAGLNMLKSPDSTIIREGPAGVRWLRPGLRTCCVQNATLFKLRR
ncbi:uncharacterized protein LOC120434289 [Oreochromis aureus]|uniref:uncharacterized protein LOC120434289 n=1 Tax=Oreochromis aureus TaxID=47969 RepID=UPI001953B128|nr:uncharacterized protein LOC120434289 [Oreochromis aureus]